MSEDGIKTLRAGAIELITILRDSMCALFQDPPIEDISSIYSPLPDTPATPASVPPTPGGFVPMSPMPLRTPSKGGLKKDTGDEFAFLPPGANSLGGVHYLSKILTLLGNAGCLLAELPIGPQMQERLKSMIVGARERCVHAVCIGWLRDAQNCKVLEDWTRAPENRDVTKMPAQFLQVEAAVIGGMQKLLYLSEVKSSEIIVCLFPLSNQFIYVKPRTHIFSPHRQQNSSHMCEVSLLDRFIKPFKVCLRIQSDLWQRKSGMRSRKR